MLRCLNWLVAFVIFIGSNKRGVHDLEAVHESLLCEQNVYPSITPCFGCVNDLLSRLVLDLQLDSKLDFYLGEHFIGIIKILEQHSNL